MFLISPSSSPPVLFSRSRPNFNQALSSSLDKNPYAIIKNKYGAKVGQLVGDGVVLTFLPGNPSPSTLFSLPLSRPANHTIGGQVNLVSPRALVVPTGPSSIGYTLKNPMFVCVALRDDIPKSHKAFPVMDIAISTYVRLPILPPLSS